MSERDEDEENPLNNGEMRDEDEEEVVPRTRWQRFKDFMSFLKDYQTSKDVSIKDRRLGYIYKISFVVILLYLIIVVFLINKQYLDIEKVNGDIYVTLIGSARSTGDNEYVWDITEENPWGHETVSAFVPSKVIITKKQTYGLCVDPLLYCETDDDCDPIDLPNVIEGNHCQDTSEGTKGCGSWKWCPPENNDTSVIYYLEGASHQILWARWKVEFDMVGSTTKDTYSTDDIELYPGPNSNAWEVNDITLLTGSNFSDITDKGAVIQVSVVVLCVANPFEDCNTHMQARRLDEVDGGGYSIQYAHYYREGDTLYRDLYHMKGVRFLFDSLGVYIGISLYKIVLQISSALGLLIAASAITDGVMLSLLKEKSHFRMLKVKESQDFNEDD
ncbi:unnamed protein product [Blepharisma stoltei]|uniref:ATP receptor n=1 Tax=Blepharisma stoltei TaxID=1481888 RepID=A0AAU9IAX2_9CILI|nr:unnamed protein product [Blepharisma stoltei]